MQNTVLPDGRVINSDLLMEGYNKCLKACGFHTFEDTLQATHDMIDATVEESRRQEQHDNLTKSFEPVIVQFIMTTIQNFLQAGQAYEKQYQALTSPEMLAGVKKAQDAMRLKKEAEIAADKTNDTA